MMVVRGLTSLMFISSFCAALDGAAGRKEPLFTVNSKFYATQLRPRCIDPLGSERNIFLFFLCCECFFIQAYDSVKQIR